VVDGTVWLEIDVVHDVFIVMGVDRNAEHRANVGL
jgi:phage tail tube protein FII